MRFCTLGWFEIGAEIAVIALVALALVTFLEPVIKRLQLALGIEDGHENDVRRPWPLRAVVFSFLLLNGVAHSLLHEAVKSNLTVSYTWALVLPLTPMLVTYRWILGWNQHPPNGAKAGAVIGAVLALINLSGSLVSLSFLNTTWVHMFVLASFSLISVTPFFVGGLAVDKGWGWGLGWESHPSLSIMASMTVGYGVLSVFSFGALLRMPEIQEVLRGPVAEEMFFHVPFFVVQIFLSCVMAVGWGLGLFISGFDAAINRRLRHPKEVFPKLEP